jgi:hypothetical protein
LGFGSTGIFGGNSNRHTNEGVIVFERRLERTRLQGRAANVKAENLTLSRLRSIPL